MAGVTPGPWHLGEAAARKGERCGAVTAGGRRMPSAPAALPPPQPAPGNGLLLTDGIFPKLLLQFIFINWLN